MNSSASSDRASGEIVLPITPVLTSGERILRRFMESLLGLVAVHWDHEPANRAAASWTAPVLWRFRLARLHRQSARRLAHSKTWRSLRRFMERANGARQRRPMYGCLSRGLPTLLAALFCAAPLPAQER